MMDQIIDPQNRIQNTGNDSFKKKIFEIERALRLPKLNVAISIIIRLLDMYM